VRPPHQGRRARSIDIPARLGEETPPPPRIHRIRSSSALLILDVVRSNGTGVSSPWHYTSRRCGTQPSARPLCRRRKRGGTLAVRAVDQGVGRTASLTASELKISRVPRGESGAARREQRRRAEEAERVSAQSREDTSGPYVQQFVHEVAARRADGRKTRGEGSSRRLIAARRAGAAALGGGRQGALFGSVGAWGRESCLSAVGRAAGYAMPGASRGGAPSHVREEARGGSRAARRGSIAFASRPRWGCSTRGPAHHRRASGSRSPSRAQHAAATPELAGRP